MDVKLTYDPRTDAARLELSNHTVVDSEQVAPDLGLDFDEDGRVVAIEILGASRRLPTEALQGARKMTA